MKKYNYLLVLLCLLSFLGIGNAQVASLNLASDDDLLALFTPEEIKALEKMVTFVDVYVQETTKVATINKAYHQLFTEWNAVIVNGKYIKPIPEEDKYAFLKSSNPEVFNAIWEFETNFGEIVYEDSMLTDFKGIKMLKLKPESRFMDYLKVKSNTNEFYSDFCELIEIVGGISASIPFEYTEKNAFFDYTTVSDRLFAAIFIVTNEVDMNKKLDIYFGK